MLRFPVYLRSREAAPFASDASVLKLYQYAICPFCCKLKAFLNWKKIAFSATDVNPLTKSEIAFSKDYKKVPIVLHNGHQINDSSAILAKLVSEMKATGSLPRDFKDSTDGEISKWLEFVDKRLAVVLFPNITRNMFESWEAFGYINEVPHFNSLQKFALRISGALAMRLANGKIKKKYEISDERLSLLEAVNEWTRSGLTGREFHGGDKPDLADVAMYGSLQSIEKFYTFSWLLGQSNRELVVWFNRMRDQVGESSCVSRD